MILAAGKGTRVRPLTYAMPKPMIPVLGKPVMEYVVELLVRHGFDEIVVNTSYLSTQIEDYFRDGRRFGARIGYSFEGELTPEGTLEDRPLGSAGGLSRVQQHSGFFDETFAVLCADAILDVDLTAALRFHRQAGAIATLVCKRVERAQVSSYGVVVADARGRVGSFQEKPAPAEARSDLANAGIYLFDPAVFRFIPPGETYDIGSQLFPALVAAGQPLYASEAGFRWIDIGNSPDYWSAVQLLLGAAADLAPPPGVEVRPGVWAGVNVRADWARITVRPPVVVDASCRLEAGCFLLGPSVLGRGCVVEEGAIVDRSVIFDYTRVASGAEVKEKVVAGRWCVGRDGAVVDLHQSELSWVIDDARRRAGARPPGGMEDAEDSVDR
ncbi:MAG: NDP-sugar synthase [Vicinamibacteria bacterium]